MSDMITGMSRPRNRITQASRYNEYGEFYEVT